MTETASSSLTAALRRSGSGRRTVCVNTAGAVYGELANAEHGPITFANNGQEKASFKMSTADPAVALLFAEEFREVQLWEGDEILAWGPVSTPQIELGFVTFTVESVCFYFTKRYVGPLERPNLLVNGDFADGLAGWDTLRSDHYYDFGNLGDNAGGQSQEGAAIEQDMTPVEIEVDDVPPSTTYTVVSGDILWDLAITYYGRGTEWRTIYNANQAQIETDARASGLWDPRDPGHWIFPGQEFDIPQVQAA